MDILPDIAPSAYIIYDVSVAKLFPKWGIEVFFQSEKSRSNICPLPDKLTDRDTFYKLIAEYHLAP